MMLGAQKEVTFTLNAKLRFLPNTGQILSFTENEKTKNPNWFDARGQLISYYSQDSGYSYTTNSFIYNTVAKLTPGQRRTIADAIKSKNDPIYTEEFVENYTALPYKLPEKAKRELDMLNIDKNNLYDAASKVAQSFSADKGFTYAQKPPFFSKEDDIIEKLFETKIGHCVYYSTAMFMMTRELKIPSRLAAGYLTVEDKDGKQVVSRSNPYCWVECYFPNLGWVMFDPSPRKSAIAIGGGQSATNTDKPPEPELVKPEEDMQKEEEPPEPEKPFPWIAVILPSGLILAIIIYLLLRSWWAPRLCTPEAVCRRYMSPVLQAEFFWRDMLRQYKCIGYARREGETMRELASRAAEEFIYRNEDAVMWAIEVIESLHYGGVTPKSSDIDLLVDACRMLDMEARWKMTPLKYFLKRRLNLQ